MRTLVDNSKTGPCPGRPAKIEPRPVSGVSRACFGGVSQAALQEICPHIATHVVLKDTGHWEMCLLCRAWLGRVQ